jgi:hypothetical protein
MKLSHRSLIKITLITFLTLFTILHIIETKQELSKTSIDNLSIKDINKHKKIEAIIIKQKAIKNNNFLTLKSPTTNKTINAIIFDNNKTLSKKQTYEIEGKITLYNQEIEIIINQIKKI